MDKLVTTTDNYAANAQRVLHLMDEKQRGFHNYLAAETDGFTNWNFSRDALLDRRIVNHFADVSALLGKVQVDTGYSGRRFEGRAYKQTRDLDIAEIAKLVRKELALEFPGCTFSVKIDRFSGGQSLDVYIADVDFDALSDELKRWLDSGKTYAEFTRQVQSGSGAWRQRYFNDRYRQFEGKVSRILNQYRMDDSDSMTDYFHTNFYGHVHRPNVEYLLAKRQNPNLRQEQKRQERQQREAQAAEAAARKAKNKELLGDFQKGEWVYYIAQSDNRQYWTKGELLPALILKTPNGRARWSSYQVEVYVPAERRSRTSRTKEINGTVYGYFNYFNVGPGSLTRQMPNNDTETAKARLRLLALKLKLNNGKK